MFIWTFSSVNATLLKTACDAGLLVRRWWVSCCELVSLSMKSRPASSKRPPVSMMTGMTLPLYLLWYRYTQGTYSSRYYTWYLGYPSRSAYCNNLAYRYLLSSRYIHGYQYMDMSLARCGLAMAAMSNQQPQPFPRYKRTTTTNLHIAILTWCERSTTVRVLEYVHV